MKKFMLIIILDLSFLISCNSDMVNKGIDSMADPRVPEINVKQEEININNNDNFPFEFANGVSIFETSESVVFIIENIGTSELEITSIENARGNEDEFDISMPESNIIPSDQNTSFTAGFILFNKYN